METTSSTQKDVLAFEAPAGRRLDSHIILHHIVFGAETDLSTDKDGGTNNLNPRYSPNGSKIIFENRSNDGSGSPSIYIYDILEEKRTKVLDNAAMPDWH